MEKKVQVPIVEDLLLLPAVDETALIATLRARFQKRLIYSNIGENIIISINPRKQIDSSNLQQLYYDYAKDTSTDKVAPQTHVFLFADKVYHRMVNEQQDQSVFFW